MAVCNLFNTLNNPSGNFMLFSQYVEDITHGYTYGDSWKVVPTKFVALNIDYDKVDSIVLNNGMDNHNVAIPKYIQNCFENACAYGRANYSTWDGNNNVNESNWNPNISRNLFWNALYEGKLINIKQYGLSTTVTYIPEIVYYGDITMHSYNEHQGMGYGEIYCYIPTNAEKMNCNVIMTSNADSRMYDDRNNSSFLEGFTDRYVENYPQRYFYNKDFEMVFESDEIDNLLNSSDLVYNINTIVLLYSVFTKLNDEWVPMYTDIPMGMYIAGMFDDNNKLTNKISKYVSTSYGSGTSYGLRVCTRFTAQPNGAILSDSEIVTDDSGYANMCQMMSLMNENLAKMLEISRISVNALQDYKESLNVIKNNRTNVPYVKDVNGTDCWFVNGKLVATVHNENSTCCNELAKETIQKRLDNLLDDNPNNDYGKISDPNGCDCDTIDIRKLAESLGLDPNDFPGAGEYISNNFEIASDDEMLDILDD